MRIVSGVQPSSDVLHIGNYFGAIRQWLDFQKEPENECLFFIADLHALTEPTGAEEFNKRVLSIAKDYIALGIKPENLFLQSTIPQHAQLMWILSTVCALGDLERMTQFKDKSQKVTKEEGVNAGLFLYPVLMAADILLYRADKVPVGDDQFQHLELTREIARRFNHKFGFDFKVPEPYPSLLGGRVMSLSDPSKKMSKSLGSDSYIGIFDTQEQIEKKIARAVTDSDNEIRYDTKNKPGLANLIEIFSLFEENLPEKIAASYKDRKYSEFKTDLAKAIINYRPFSEARERRAEITDEDVIEKIKTGTKKARTLAEETMKDINRVVGLIKL